MYFNIYEKGKKNSYVCIYIYIYIYISAVKISSLTQAIHFPSLKVLKIFNAVNAGAGLGLVTQFKTAASLFS